MHQSRCETNVFLRVSLSTDTLRRASVHTGRNVDVVATTKRGVPYNDPNLTKNFGSK